MGGFFKGNFIGDSKNVHKVASSQMVADIILSVKNISFQEAKLNDLIVTVRFSVHLAVLTTRDAEAGLCKTEFF